MHQCVFETIALSFYPHFFLIFTLQQRDSLPEIKEENNLTISNEIFLSQLVHAL